MTFIESQWQQLCENTQRTAEFSAAQGNLDKSEIESDCDSFCNLAAPNDYKELLQRNVQARDLAIKWSGADSEGPA